MGNKKQIATKTWNSEVEKKKIEYNKKVHSLSI